MIVMEYTQAGKMLHCLHTSIRSGSADRQQRHTFVGNAPEVKRMDKHFAKPFA